MSGSGPIRGALLVAALCLAGCAAVSEQRPQPEKGGDRLLRSSPAGAPAEPFSEYKAAGYSVEQRPLECLVLGRGAEVVLILGAVHGDEEASARSVRELGRFLYNRPRLLEGRRVVLIPEVNPDGVARRTRRNARGVDLNRNFSAPNRIDGPEHGWHALSEPESRAVAEAIGRYRPDRVVSIHQPLGCIDYDGPGEHLASHMARFSDLPVRKLGAKPGSLGSYAGLALGIPIITFEMAPGADDLSTEALWRRYGPALVASVTYPDTDTAIAGMFPAFRPRNGEETHAPRFE